MNTRATLLGFIISSLLFGILPAQSSVDQTLSPYFHVYSTDPANAKLPLQRTSVEAAVAGVIADVTVTQVYVNSGSVPLEARYVFPASTRAAVHGMTMQVGRRVIEAEVRERAEAEEIYEEAIQEGRTASLLQQERANVFSMQVGNILPGDSIVIRLSYTEMLIPRDGKYQFVYPTVVMPRYTQLPEPGDTTGTIPAKGIPYTHAGEPPAFSFGFQLHLAAGMAVQGVSSTTHTLDIVRNEDLSVDIGIPNGLEGNRDVIIDYSLRGEEMQTGLLTYKEKGEQYFLYMAQPPARVVTREPLRREYIFIMDVSGSMSGFPLETSKHLMSELLSGLNEQDRFNILCFAGGSDVLNDKESLPATPKNIKKGMKWFDESHSGGGTEMLNAMKVAMEMPRDPDLLTTFVICTDGAVSAESQTFDYIRNHLGEANFFTFGIGSSTNRLILEGIAHAGQGEAFVVTDQSIAMQEAERFKTYVEHPLLTDIRMDWGTAEVYDVEPVTVNDLYAERPVVIFGKYRGDFKTDVILNGRNGAGPVAVHTPVDVSRPGRKNEALKYLWARERLRYLSDFGGSVYNRDSDVVQEITDIGLKYNLLTDYTSFVAVDKRRRNKGGDQEPYDVPQPLPDGVGDGAIGYSIDGIQIRGTVSILNYQACCVGTIVDIEDISSQSVYRIMSRIDFPTMAQRPSITMGEQVLTGRLDVQIPNLSGYAIPGMSYSVGAQQPELPLGIRSGTIDLSQFLGGDGLIIGLQTDMFGRTGLSGAITQVVKKEKLATNLMVNGNFSPQFIDRNEDQFADDPVGLELTVYNSWNGSFKSKKQEDKTWRYKFGGLFQMNEWNAGTHPDHLPVELRTTLRTKASNGGGFAHVEYGGYNGWTLSADLSVAHQSKQGLYGSRLYTGRDSRTMARVNGTRFGGKLTMSYGLDFRYDELEEHLDYQSRIRTDLTPGAYGKAKLALWDRMILSGWMRGEWNQNYGPILLPGLSLSTWLRGDWRLGFSASRTAMYTNAIGQFAPFLSGLRNVSGLDQIPGESAWTGTLFANKTWRYSGGSFLLNAKAEVYRYEERLVVDLTNPAMIRFSGLEGQNSMGMQHELLGTMDFNKIRTKVTLLGTYSRLVRTRPLAGTLVEPFLPPLRVGLYTEVKPFSRWRFTASCQWIGAQALPEIPGLSVDDPFTLGKSPSYLLVNTGVALKLKAWELKLGGENLLNAVAYPLVVGAYTPRNAPFEPGMAWGPTLGARVTAGLSYRWHR